MGIRHTPVALTLLAVGVVAGCTSDSRSVCLSADSAEVCIVGSDGNLQVRAKGLEPGSTLRVTSDKLGDASYPIAETGAPDGQVGMLGDLEGEVISISATAASGEQMGGELTVGE